MSTNNINCVLAVNAIIINDWKVLLLKHNRPEKAKWKLWLPWWKIEKGESFDEWLAREIKEETGIIIEGCSIKKLCILHDFPETTCKHLYLIIQNRATKNFIFDKQEIQSIDWVSLNDIKTIAISNFRNDRVYKVLCDYIDLKFKKNNFIYSLV